MNDRHDEAVKRYRRFYATLLRCYPRTFREQFGTSMQQTFGDLCRERRERRPGDRLFPFVVFVFSETSIGIMKERAMDAYGRNKNIVRMLMVVALLLTAPFALTLLNPNAEIHGGSGGGWDWTASDFVVMGVLLLAAGMAVLTAIRYLRSPLGRSVAVGFIGVCFLVFWAELAVDAVSQALALLS